MKFCSNDHDEVVYESKDCPVCDARDKIKRHEVYQEELIRSNRELMGVVKLAAESQGWGNDDDRWPEFYSKARNAMRNGS